MFEKMEYIWLWNENLLAYLFIHLFISLIYEIPKIMIEKI